MSSSFPLNKRRRLADNSNENDGDDDYDIDHHADAADNYALGDERGSAAAAADDDGGTQQHLQTSCGSNVNNDDSGTLFRRRESAGMEEQIRVIDNKDDDDDEALNGSSSNNGDANDIVETSTHRQPTPCSLHSALHQHKTAVWSARQNLGTWGGVATATCNNISASDSTSTPRPPPPLPPQIMPRWRTHQIAEDYISLASSILLPPVHLGSFGYDPAMGRYPIEQITAVGYLTSPVRRPMVIEKWNPYEIALFEGALALHGKNFHTIHKRYVTSKSTKEIIEFYYIWKKTSHGRRWKSSFGEQQGGGGGDDSGGGSDGSSDCDSISGYENAKNGSTSEKKIETNNEKKDHGLKNNRKNSSSTSSILVGGDSVEEGNK